MDDPGWAWPAWKFGMKGDDLFTKLHDQYNTFASTIQDPEAFHHDVYEISNEADTEDEFHRLMAGRKQQRLRELNESLESAAIEIIANPKLIGTDQWQYALQLFRTRSLDSLVRYFASYLPDDYLQHHSYHSASSAASSFTDRSSVHSASTNPSTVGDAHGPCFFPDHDDTPLMTYEPLTITTSIAATSISAQLPPSPRSMTMQSDTSVSSPADLDHDYHHPYSPPRTLSISGSEADAFARARLDYLEPDDEETSQSDDPDSLATSVSDLVRSESSLGSMPHESQPAPTKPAGVHHDCGDDDDESLSAQLPLDFFDDMDAETPTPKPDFISSSYLSAKSFRPAHRIPSPYRATSPKSPRIRRREASPTPGCVRRSPEESMSRIQKPIPDVIRSRPRGRRRGLD